MKNVVDVIVVGCGPVGTMAALRCAQRGLRVLAIDRETNVYPLPRAIGMDAEVQDLFARAGLIDSLRATSTEFLGGEFVDASRTRVVGFNREAGTHGPLGHPPMIAFDQPTVDAFLRTAARQAGVQFELGTALTALTTGDEYVRIKLASGESRRSRWLIGADGAKSTVRDLVGLQLIDQEFDQTWLVVDTTLLDPALELPAVPRQICDAARIMTFVPGHDTRRRWEFRLNPGETRDHALEPDFAMALLSEWGSSDQLRIDRAAVYRFHATVADRFQHGRVFLAGDAAHQMPPFNGQGMCAGMRDAENLAWKLAAVAHEHGGEALLATYDEERRPHAARQVEHSVDAGKLMEAIAHSRETALDSGYGRRSFPRLEHDLIDVDHPFGGMPLPAPADDSFQVGNGWTLVRGPHARGEIPGVWREVAAEVHTVSPDAFVKNFESDDTIVVRPDRFVAAVTKDLGATTIRLAAMLGKTGAAETH